MTTNNDSSPFVVNQPQRPTTPPPPGPSAPKPVQAYCFHGYHQGGCAICGS